MMNAAVLAVALSTLAAFTSGASTAVAKRSAPAPDISELESLAMQETAQWDALLSGPKVLHILGNLMVLSSKVDFGLEEAEPKGGYKHIKYKNSFSATLVQVSDSALTTFRQAQTNMHSMFLSMSKIPQRTRKAMKILNEPDLDLIKAMLPIQLDIVQKLGAHSGSLTTQITQSFEAVLQLLKEVVAATTSAKEINTEKKKAAEDELRSKRIEANSAKNVLDMYEKRMKKTEETLELYEKRYQEAMDAIPTGWDAVGLEFGRACVKLFTMVGTTLVGALGKELGVDPADDKTPDEEKLNAVVETGLVLKMAPPLAAIITEIKGKLDRVASGKWSDSLSPSESFKSVIKSLESISKIAAKSKSFSKVKNIIAECTKDSKRLINDMSAAFANLANVTTPQDKEKMRPYYRTIADLSNKIKPLLYADTANSNQVVQQSQNRRSDQFSGPNGDAKWKAYTESQMLIDIRKRNDALLEQRAKKETEYAKLTAAMSSLNFSVANYKEILELAKEGIQHLSEMKEQWVVLATFFRSVDKTVKVGLKSNVKGFIETAKAKAQMTYESETATDLLKAEVENVERWAKALRLLAGTWVAVSRKYFVKQLAGLSKMVSATTKNERINYRREVDRHNEESVRAINVYVEKREGIYKNLLTSEIDASEAKVNEFGGATEQDRRNKAEADAIFAEFKV